VRAPVPAPAPYAGLAVQLYGRLLGARTADEAAHRLVAELSRALQASRVSVGLHQAGRTRLLAVSNLDDQRPEAELPTLLLGAMDEALEQALPMLQPAPPDAPDCVRLGHAALQRLGGGSVLTLPLGDDGRPLGAVCLERHGGLPFTPPDAERLVPLLALALPLLALLQRADAPWHRRLRQHGQDAAQALRQPQRRGLRWALAAGVLLLAALAGWPLPHQVAGRARIEGAVQRVLVAPTDGFVKTAHARPGDRVKAGAPLVDLMEQDLELERQRWSSQLAQHENAYAAALAKADRAQAAVAVSRVAEAQAQLALLDGQLGRSRITAPFDGVVIEGDLSRSVGAPVRQGDALLTVAAGDDYRVIVDIDETDIARVSPGQSGQLSVSGLDWTGHALRVERVAALARTVEGRNVFEVEARLLQATPALRPGLLGHADLVVGQRPPLQVWAERAADRLRLAWWRWVG
jgi:biotin carboxyl carrier protein